MLATYPQERVVIVVTTNSGGRARGVPVRHHLAERIATLVFTPR